MERDTFDIVAKPEAKADSGKQNRQMVQTLLADRFQLQFHRDVKELPVYVLTVAKNGPKLQEAKDARHGIAGRPRSIESKGADMPALAATLARRLGRTVIDKTGLTGLYDFTLTFSPIDAPAVGPAGQLSPETDSAEPSIFTALQAQLGLKLESSKGPVAVLVIDRAEKPSEN
jgi:uncharacterized protein (TIGR03435 family)